MDVLEYLVRLRGAGTAAAEMRGLAGELGAVAKEQARVGATGAEAAAGTSKLGAAGGLAGKTLLGVAAAAVGVGFEAVKMATTFNHEMLRIRTDAGASNAELRNMKAGVLDLAASGASMGQGPMSLAQGLYHLESLGIRGSHALKALALASQESAISGANLEQTTTAMGAAMYTGIKGTGDLTRLMGTLNATVGAGNMRFQDLVEALGTGVLPSAKVAGLSIQDVSAALAVATDSGYQASSAAAQLGTAFHFLYAPGTKAVAALASIHLGQSQLAQDMHKPQGLLVALRDLRSHLDGLSKVQQAQVLNAILPGGRGRILLTELTMLDRLQGKYRQINATAGGFQGSVSAQRRDPMTELHTASARVQADMIRLGNVLGPVVVPALAALLNVGAKVLEWLVKLPQTIQTVVHWFNTAGGASSGLRQNLMTVGSGFIEFGRIVLAVVRTIVGFILPGLVTAFRGGFNVIAGLVKLLAGILTLDFGKAWSGVAQIFKGGIQTALGVLQAATAPIRSVAASLWNGLKSGLVAVINWIVAQVNSVINSINSVTSSIPLIGGNVIGTISPIGAGGPTPTGNAGVRNRNLSFSTPGHQGAARPHPAGDVTAHAAGWHHGDIVVQVGNHEIARVFRHQIRQAMAANA